MNPDSLLPSFDLNLGGAVDSANINALTTPTANTNGSSSGGFLSDVTRNILDLFDSGVQVYQKVDQITGGSASRTAAAQQAAGQTVVTAPSPTVAFGLNQNQLLLIAAGLAGILVISVISRK